MGKTRKNMDKEEKVTATHPHEGVGEHLVKEGVLAGKSPATT